MKKHILILLLFVLALSGARCPEEQASKKSAREKAVKDAIEDSSGTKKIPADVQRRTDEIFRNNPRK